MFLGIVLRGRAHRNHIASPLYVDMGQIFNTLVNIDSVDSHRNSELLQGFRSVGFKSTFWKIFGSGPAGSTS